MNFTAMMPGSAFYRSAFGQVPFVLASAYSLKKGVENLAKAVLSTDSVEERKAALGDANSLYAKMRCVTGSFSPAQRVSAFLRSLGWFGASFCMALPVYIFSYDRQQFPSYAPDPSVGSVFQTPEEQKLEKAFLHLARHQKEFEHDLFANPEPSEKDFLNLSNHNALEFLRSTLGIVDTSWGQVRRACDELLQKYPASGQSLSGIMTNYVKDLFNEEFLEKRRAFFAVTGPNEESLQRLADNFSDTFACTAKPKTDEICNHLARRFFGISSEGNEFSGDYGPVKQIYRELSSQLHPDKNPDKANLFIWLGNFYERVKGKNS